MRRTRKRFAVGVVVGLALIGAACSSDDNKSGASAGSGTSSSSVAGANIDYSKLSGTLNGSGSSFQDAFEQKAKSEFGKVAAGVTVNYMKSGSGAGKTDLANQ